MFFFEIVLLTLNRILTFKKGRPLDVSRSFFPFVVLTQGHLQLVPAFVAGCDFRIDLLEQPWNDEPFLYSLQLVSLGPNVAQENGLVFCIVSKL